MDMSEIALEGRVWGKGGRLRPEAERGTLRNGEMSFPTPLLVQGDA